MSCALGAECQSQRGSPNCSHLSNKNMPTIHIKLAHESYDIVIGSKLLHEVGRRLRNLCPHEKMAIIADESVYELHGAALLSSVERADYRATVAKMHADESSKNHHTVLRLYDELFADKIERGSPVIAFGGGITGDTAGFVAATYLRGVALVQVPTSLLAMVDSSVGGKVAVNVVQGKNLIGAFYQPKLVIIDPEVLLTLPKRELLCGLAECIKHGVLGDRELFEWTQCNLAAILQLDMKMIAELIERNVRFKATIVAADEKEQGVRALLNLGHTFGHAIEATSGYGVYHHGEAVAIGCAAASHLSVMLGRITSRDCDSIVSCFAKAGLPVKATLADTDVLMEAMTLDKKVQNGKIRLVLPDEIGKSSVVADVRTEDVRAAWHAVRN